MAYFYIFLCIYSLFLKSGIINDINDIDLLFRILDEGGNLYRVKFV